MKEPRGVWFESQRLVLGLLGKKACQEDPLAMSVATQVLVDFKMARACGCTNRRLCRVHHKKARDLLGDPRDCVTIKSEPYEYSGDKKDG